MIKTIILDFDGVIVESLGVKTQAFRDLFSDCPQELEQIMGYHLAHNSVSRYIKFEHIVTHILHQTYDEERKKELGARFSRLVRQKVIECPYVAGAEEFLRYFYPRVPLYVASSTPQEELEAIIKARGINKYFRDLYGSPPWEKSKVVRKIMTEEGTSPDAIAYVGDSHEDYKVAQNTGVFFLARINEEPFDTPGIPVYEDLFGIKQYLQKIMDGNES